MSRTVPSFAEEGLKRFLHGMDRRIKDLERGGRWQFDSEITATEIIAATGGGQMLILQANGGSIADGGDFVTFDTNIYQHGFGAAVSSGAEAITWPLSFAGGTIQVEWAWETYQGGGTIEIEVGGVVPAWGEVVSGAAGQTICRSRPVHIAAGETVKIKVTQSSGSAQTADVRVAFAAPDPADKTSLYAAAVMADGPVAYWRLGETSGSAASDWTGNGHGMSYVNAPTLGADGVMLDGSLDRAVTLNGTSQAVAGSDWDAMDFAGTAPFTIEAWFRLASSPSSPSDLSHIVGKQDNNAGNDGWEVYVSKPSGIGVTCKRQDGSSEDSVTYDGLIVGANHHLVFVYDGATMHLYIDGQLVDSQASTRSMPGNVRPVWIGAEQEAVGGSGTPGFFFDGTIDEVAIYDHALSAMAVSEHYSIGSQAA